MADGYLDPQYETDPDALTDRAVDSFADRFPNATLAEGSMLLWDVETDAQTAADIAELALNVAESVTTTILGRLLGEAQRQPVPAGGTVTFTVTGDTTASIPAGTMLEATGPSGEPVSLETVQDAQGAQGVTTIPLVPVQAIDEGTDGNGASGPVLGAESLPFATAATLDVPTSGGSDGEEDQDYLGRLVRLARLTAPRPITPADIAEFVTLMVEGVGAAVALENTVPGPPAQTDVAGAFTVGIRAPDGTDPGAVVVQAAQQVLDDALLSTIQAHVVPANYTTVTITGTVVAWAGYDVSVTQQACVDAITEYLSPATWGAPPTRGDIGTGDQPPWTQDTTVRVAEIIARLDGATGVNYVDRTSVTIQGVTDDLVLDGLLPLPVPGPVTITVTAP